MPGMKRILLMLCSLVFGGLAPAQLPGVCTQAVVGVTEGWNSSHARVSLVERNANGQWVRVLGPFPARLGRNGTVWGLGIHANPRGATLKKEGDGRSPAGIFAIGGLWTTTKTPVKHDRALPEVKVGPNDLWVTDLNMPKYYNRYVRLDHPAATPWELHEQMKQTDYPHSIKLLICHNTAGTPGRPVLGGGSSIFFHIWRNDGAAPTAGCTTLREQELRAIISRLSVARHPVYVLLPSAEYVRLRPSWRLP